MRKIYISGEINEETFKEFCQEMDALEDTKEDIDIVLNSPGGNALDAIAFACRMRLSPCAITITVFGLAGSAAVMILAAGTLRRMTKESWVMVHEDMGSYKNIKTTDLEQQAFIARQLENHWCILLQEFTGTSVDIWRDLHKRGDSYLTPQDCLKLGLIQEII